MKTASVPLIVLAHLVLSCSRSFITPADAAGDMDAPADASRACAPGTDPDGDTIPTALEGEGDADGDTVPNSLDGDSDGDRVPDAVEAGDDDCSTPPADSDGDGTPDYLDRDSDANGLDDYVEGSIDTDGDGIPDAADPDNDGDGIPDDDEIGDDPDDPHDGDGDGVPDYLDADSDGDTIPDAVEGTRDTDNDGTPDYLDTDADGDGILDEEEAGGCAPDSTPPVDTDLDGLPDYVDIDSDGDGVTDAMERVLFTSRCSTDTDGDGFSDLVEWAHPDADPLDPSSGIPPDDYIVILRPGESLERDLEFGTAIMKADVFFLVDTTGSMYQEIDRIRSTLNTTIIPTIGIRIPDAWHGVGWFADFPFGNYGQPPDLPFELLLPMAQDPTEAQIAVDALPRSQGDDSPESQVEALYQTATGEGLGSYIPVRLCTDRIGGACFRPGSLPVVLLFTDAPMHNGPPGTVADDYAGFDPDPHDWEDAIRALNRLRAKVIGLDSEGPDSRDAWNDLLATAVATETVDFKGNPLVFDIGRDGEDLDTKVVSAIEILATQVRIDVDTAVVDLPDGYDEPGWTEVDAGCFIRRRTPQAGWIPPAGYTSIEAVEGYDVGAFYGVLPGTRVTFRILFANERDDAAPCFEALSIPRAFAAKIIVRGNGFIDLDERVVLVVVPP
jgi:hypothetical protein